MPAVATYRLALGLLLALTASACETPQWALKLDEAFAPGVDKKKAAADEGKDQRRKYLANRDSKALNWLLSHQIQSGMSYDEVCQILGERGEIEERKNWLTTKGGLYQVGDDFYSFGPDNKGRKLYLAFRDKTLVHFDPEEYAGKSH